jgi:autotransporter-associated beta strand protein
MLRTSLAALALSMLTLSASAQTWIGAASGNWSVGTNWSGGIPVSSNTTVLNFNNPFGTTAITATNDIAATFLLDILNLNNSSTATFTVASSTGNALRFDGANRQINTLNGFSSTVSSAISSNGSLTLNHGTNGYGLLTLSGVISDGTSPASLVINARNTNGMGITSYGAVTLSGSNTFTGGVTLNSGNLNVGAATALGTGTLTVNGGTLAGTATIGNNVVANGGIRSFSGTLTYTGVISGNGGWAGQAGAGATIQSASTLTGDVSVGGLMTTWAPLGSSTGGTFTLSGLGTLQGATRYTIANGGTLAVNNSATNVADRILDTASVNLQNGSFVYTAATAAISGETLGAVNGQGYNTLTIGAGTGAGANATVAFSGLSRTNRGTFLIRGTNLNGTSATAGNSFLTVGGAPTLVGGGGADGTAQVSILPWAVGGTTTSDTGSTFLTYNGTGFRPLNTTTEFLSTLATSTSNDNVRLAAATVNAGVANANSLIIASGLTGGGQVNVNSGAVLITTTTASDNGLNFGSAEGTIFASSSNTLSGALTGSNGLTKSGTGTTTLTGNNTGLTGTLTINDGRIGFTNANSIAGTGTINVSGRGSAAGFTWTSAGAGVAISRNVNILGGMFAINAGSDTTAGQILDMQGAISGSGGLYIDGGSSATLANTVRLSSANTYSGPTRIFGGNVRIASDSAFGNGGSVDLGAFSAVGVILEGNWITNRRITNTFGTLVNTNGFNAVFNGEFVSNSSSISKTGTGSLTINNNVFGPTTNTFNVDGGGFYINSNGTNFTISGSGTTAGVQGTFGGTGRVGNVFLSTTGIVRPGVESGSIATMQALNLTWNPGAQMSFDIGALGNNDAITIFQALTKGTGGSGTGYQFNFNDQGAQVGTYTLLTFASTTFTNVGDFSAVWNNPNISGNFILNSGSLQYQITAVPEPTSMIALGLGAVALIRRRRTARK